MELRISTDIHPKNLAGIRAVLHDVGNDDVFELTQEQGTARLAWQRERDGVVHDIHLTVPMGWLADPAKVSEFQRAARLLSKSVLAAGA